MDKDRLQDLFFASPHGPEILRCIQCGTCSGSCPLPEPMDHAPREIFALIRSGDIDEAVASNTPWFCVSCYRCMTRCPQQIAVTDIMYSLKQLAVRLGCIPPGHKLPHLYNAFSGVVEKNGRVNEAGVMARYGLRHPLEAAAQIPLALRLLRRGRMELRPGRIRTPENLTALLRRSDAGEKPS